MAVLRAADQPVPESWLTRDQQVTLPRGASADLARPLEALLTLESPVEQRQRAVDGLVSDGLAHRCCAPMTRAWPSSWTSPG
jgi:A/G-specific adenine glycosylase